MKTNHHATMPPAVIQTPLPDDREAPWRGSERAEAALDNNDPQAQRWLDIFEEEPPGILGGTDILRLEEVRHMRRRQYGLWGSARWC
jgi:hypothetical protein